MRVVFDVSVLIRAALRSPLVCRVLAESIRRNSILLKSGQLVAEFAACARKPRLAESIDWDLYNQVLSLISVCGEEVSIALPFPECRDECDAYLLAMARDGRADFLVTNDGDLLSQRCIGNCRILSIEEFHQALCGDKQDL